MSSDKSVVQVDIWVINLIENVYRQRHLPAEGESGDELGRRVDVLVEVGFEDLGVDLLDVAEVCTSVEVGELLV